MFTQLSNVDSFYKLIKEVEDFDVDKIGLLSNIQLLDILLSIKNNNPCVDEHTCCYVLYNIKNDFLKEKLPEYFTLQERIKQEEYKYSLLKLKINKMEKLDIEDYNWYNDYIEIIKKNEISLSELHSKLIHISDDFMLDYRVKILNKFNEIEKVISDFLFVRLPVESLRKDFNSSSRNIPHIALFKKNYFDNVKFIEFLKGKENATN